MRSSYVPLPFSTISQPLPLLTTTRSSFVVVDVDAGLNVTFSDVVVVWPYILLPFTTPWLGHTLKPVVVDPNAPTLLEEALPDPKLTAASSISLVETVWPL